MRIDISARLRELLLLGVPIATACAPAGGPAPATAALVPASDPSCTVRRVFPQPGNAPPGATTVYDPADVRFADLHEACANEGLYCLRLCQELLSATPVNVGPVRLTSCDVGCDAQGRRIALLHYARFAQGRRPEGFAQATAQGPGTSAGRWCAQAAIFEGASVVAFRRLARELEAHDAPAELVARARAAARDEARHFRVMKRLAARFGERDVEQPQLEVGSTRGLEELARENASEGCVSETFAALVALHQGQAAADSTVRKAVARIAEDELGHAQLAWDVDDWARARLGAAASASILELRRDAARSLAAGAGAAVEPALVAALGLPDGPAEAALATRLEATLWAA